MLVLFMLMVYSEAASSMTNMTKPMTSKFLVYHIICLMRTSGQICHMIRIIRIRNGFWRFLSDTAVRHFDFE